MQNVLSPAIKRFELHPNAIERFDSTALARFV